MINEKEKCQEAKKIGRMSEWDKKKRFIEKKKNERKGKKRKH